MALQESVGQTRKGKAAKRTSRTTKKSAHKTIKLSDLADSDKDTKTLTKKKSPVKKSVSAKAAHK